MPAHRLPPITCCECRVIIGRSSTRCRPCAERCRPTAFKSRDAEERFWEKVEKTPTCWLWRGYIAMYGYGRFTTHMSAKRAVNATAHRYAYETVVGPIPDGHELHHTCEVRRCVNPAHLLPLTRAEHKREHVRMKAAA